jgi:hypothetical protein
MMTEQLKCCCSHDVSLKSSGSVGLQPDEPRMSPTRQLESYMTHNSKSIFNGMIKRGKRIVKEHDVILYLFGLTGSKLYYVTMSKLDFDIISYYLETAAYISYHTI